MQECGRCYHFRAYGVLVEVPGAFNALPGAPQFLDI